MANTINCGDLLDKAIERIAPHIPDQYTIDDPMWNENYGFEVNVFDLRTIRGDYIPVSCFRFCRSQNYTNEEVMQDFERELEDYINIWREFS